MGAAIEPHIASEEGALLAFFRRRVGPAEAEEFVQETWTRLLRCDTAGLPPDALRGVTFTIARRLLIDHHRRSAARVQLVPLEGGREPSTGPDAAPDAAHDASALLSTVDQTLAGMKPELAEVFRWRAADQVPFAEIATRQGVSIGTALSRMHQATRKLHAALCTAGFLTKREDR